MCERCLLYAELGYEEQEEDIKFKMKCNIEFRMRLRFNICKIPRSLHKMCMKM